MGGVRGGMQESWIAALSTFAPIYLPSQITVSNLSNDEEEVLSSQPSAVPSVMVSSMRPPL